MKITDSVLKDSGACAKGRRKFRKVFPNGANINAANIAKAEKHGIDYSFTSFLLPKKEKASFDRAYSRHSDKWVGSGEFDKMYAADRKVLLHLMKKLGWLK